MYAIQNPKSLCGISRKLVTPTFDFMWSQRYRSVYTFPKMIEEMSHFKPLDLNLSIAYIAYLLCGFTM